MIKRFNTIDEMEQSAAEMAIAEAVIGDSPLSGYLGSSPHGGPNCHHLEDEWADTFKVNHAVAVNSATSGLLAACMAIGIGHGDEVIVSPYTMSATAAAPKLLGARIVWADIDPETYCLDPIEVSNAITRKTKAVIVTNLFGQTASLHELKDICDQQGVYLIEDNAQAVYAREYDKYTGTIGHMGVFSLNVHKHLQVGEGGIVVTRSPILDTKLREAINHGEMRNAVNVGLNLRMTEVTAAMAREQLKKGPEIIRRRREIGRKISEEVINQGLPIIWPMEREDCVHSFYAWGGYLMQEPIRKLPEPFRRGYLRPLYELPAFKGEHLFMPVVERVESNMIIFEVCAYDPTDDEIYHLVDRLGDCF